jgi:hypothetical protein
MNENHGGPPDHDTDTSPGGRAGSQATFWTVSLLAVPVVYVLTFPPIVILSYNLAGHLGASWMAVYSVPYAWLVEHTPLHGLLRWYGDWWVSITGFETP